MSGAQVDISKTDVKVCVRVPGPGKRRKGASGNGQLEALILRDNTTGATETVTASALFVMVGANPHTGWLPESVQRDDHGFVRTGTDLTGGWGLKRPPFPFETSLPGIFAAGDVRLRSVKRVASAVGEGSIAATQVYQYLHELGDDQPARP